MAKKAFAVRVEYDVNIEMRDGIRLTADVFRPEGPGVFPVLVQRVPYGRSRPRTRDGALDVLSAARSGYAVIVQDCRGRGGSGGDFVPFVNEAADGFDTVEWAASQEWSSGRVGMFGRSYGGLCQWLAASARPPSLAAISPMFSGANVARDWFAISGELEFGFALLWAIRSLAPETLARTAPVEPAEQRIYNAINRMLDEPEWHPTPDDLGTALARLPFTCDWLAGEFADDAEHLAISDVDHVPTLVVSGWYDIFMPGAIRTYRALARRQPGRHGLVVGPWAHGGICTGTYPEIAFGASAAADAVGLSERQLSFFDRTVRAQGEEQAQGVLAFAPSRREWVSLADWPDGQMCGWSLRAVPPSGTRGTLIPKLNEWTGVGQLLRLPFDESRPVPTIGGGTFLPGLDVSANSGPRDQRPLIARPDVVVFESEPLEHDLEFFGEGELSINAGVSDAGQRLVVRLADGSMDGRLLLVSEGAGRFATSSTYPARSAARIELAPFWWTFMSGSRLTLLISCTSHPRYSAGRDPLALQEVSGSVLLDLSSALLMLRLLDREPATTSRYEQT
jgi:putative CocE/NonD family hydrolase